MLFIPCRIEGLFCSPLTTNRQNTGRNFRHQRCRDLQNESYAPLGRDESTL